MNRNTLFVGGAAALREELNATAIKARSFAGWALGLALKARGAVAAFALMFLSLFFGSEARADYSGFVTFTNGTVEFTPGVAISPVIVAIVAAIGVGIAVFVLIVGTKWVLRMLKGTK